MLLFKNINKKFDLAVYIINFILIILFYYMLEEKKICWNRERLTFYKIFGSTENISYYLFFSLYYIGFNIGVMYFYSSTFYINNKDVDYLPLNYNLIILKFIDSMNQIF